MLLRQQISLSTIAIAAYSTRILQGARAGVIYQQIKAKYDLSCVLHIGVSAPTLQTQHKNKLSTSFAQKDLFQRKTEKNVGVTPPGQHG